MLSRLCTFSALLWVISVVPSTLGSTQDDWASNFLSALKTRKGLVGVVGMPPGDVASISELITETEYLIYFRSPDSEDIASVRQAAERLNVLGTRVIVEQGLASTLPIAPNLLDAVWVNPELEFDRSHLEHYVRPNGIIWHQAQRYVKPIPEGYDDWSHPYHGPDNNPQSNDTFVKGQFATQFIATPKFSPMPQQTVIANGLMYKAMGHIAHKANQNAQLNTMHCINAYNGTILWTRPLPEGFMIHRNTMIATEEGLYLGDHESCKVFDPTTGEPIRELTVPAEITDGPVWKWMAMQDDVIYGLVGNLEAKVETIRSDRPGLGHWPWGMWDGHDYNDPRTAFGYGRTVVALERTTGKLLWHYRDSEFLDARAVCLSGNRLFCYCPEKFLLCLNVHNGEVLWRTEDPKLLEAIGPNGKAQHYITGYATTSYMKCSEDYLFFAGPQRERLVAASAHDGSLRWTFPVGNLQLVLRPEGLYAAGPENTSGAILDYETGRTLVELPARRACTRATGCVDSVFFRATGGTVRVMTDGSQVHHIAPMRPPCQDGVLIANGHLYWGPWMCGCELSLYGNIALRPTEPTLPRSLSMEEIEAQSLTAEPNHLVVSSFPATTQCWPTYASQPDRSFLSPNVGPKPVQLAWQQYLRSSDLPTAPVIANQTVFVGDRSGTLQAWSMRGEPLWKVYLPAAIFYPPTIAHDRLFVGCADGYVYAFEASSGRRLWRFRVAPNDDRIVVFGKLVSRWPVAGGVLVVDDRVYAAAGLTHYDGTVVVALDAESGKLLAHNDQSGRLSDTVNSGVSLQGELAAVDGELQFAGGGIYEIARYDLETLQCLNEVQHHLSSRYRTAFNAWYPEFDNYASLEVALPSGNVLTHDTTYDGTVFGNLTLETPRALGREGRRERDLAGEFLRRRGKPAPETFLWSDTKEQRFTAFAIGADTIIAAGHEANDPAQNFVTAIDLQSGTSLWKHPLPARTVKNGLAVAEDNGVVVTLVDGQIMSFDKE